jgi:hypothetical protein
MEKLTLHTRLQLAAWSHLMSVEYPSRVDSAVDGSPFMVRGTTIRIPTERETIITETRTFQNRQGAGGRRIAGTGAGSPGTRDRKRRRSSTAPGVFAERTDGEGPGRLMEADPAVSRGVIRAEPLPCRTASSGDAEARVAFARGRLASGPSRARHPAVVG